MEEFDHKNSRSRWNALGEAPLDEGRKNRIKARLYRTLFSNDNVTPLRPVKKRSYHYSSVAALVLLLIVALPVAVFYPDYAPFSEKELVYRTSAGETKKFILSDETAVWLNANSQFSIEEGFNHSKREVHLEGEAYFEVAHNPELPFKVYSSGIVTRVTGTSFNIRSYPADSVKLVSVTEGSVSVDQRYKGNEPSNTIRGTLDLIAGEQAELNSNSNSLLKKKIPNHGVLTSWTGRVLKYEHTPLSQVAKGLQLRHNITIQFDDPDLKKTRITGEFEDESWQEIIEMICLSTDLNYRVDGETITIYKGGVRKAQ